MEQKGRRTRALAAISGFGGVAAITLAFALLDAVPSTVSAMLLLVPITAASVIADWRIGLPVALVAAGVYSLVFLEPIGEIRIGLTQDVVIIITFAAVALAVSVLVSRRSIANRAELIGHERMLLLRSVSHDLRNPLHTIRGVATDLREQRDYDAASRDVLLGVIVDETGRMTRIVDNLLSLGRLLAGALEPDVERTAVDELVRRCVARLNRSGVQSIVVELDDDLPEVSADPVQIDQVLTNLVENALRHAPSTSRVVVSAHIAPGGVRLAVDDDGPGFSQLARLSLYQPFTSESGSSGLGLTVCKAIVEAHGGTLDISDSSTHGGAHIAFTLSIHDATATDHPDRG